MTTTNPWFLVGVAAVAPIVTALVAALRVLVAGVSRRRNAMLTNMEFVGRLRDYEDRTGTTLPSDVHDRARADLARSARLYVDRNSWQWMMSFPLLYFSLINATAYTVAVLLKGGVWLGLVESDPSMFDSLSLAVYMFSGVVIVWLLLLTFAFGVVSTRREGSSMFTERDDHLVPRPGPALERPVSRTRSTSKKRGRVRLTRAVRGRTDR